MIKLTEKFNKYYEKLEEDFLSDEARNAHYEEHVIRKGEFEPPFESAEEYEKAANSFAKTYINASSAYDDDAHLVGYIAGQDRYILYERYTGMLVIFKLNVKDAVIKNQPLIISFYVPPRQVRFQQLRDGEIKSEYAFVREFPHVEEQQRAQRQAEHIKQKEIQDKEKAEQQKLDREREKELKRDRYAKRQAKRTQKNK